MKPYFIAFKERLRDYESREVVSLCPLNMKVSAVFYEEDDSLFRSPQLALAVYDTVKTDRLTEEETGRVKGDVGFLDSVEAGGEFADDDCSNFLGYEYGEERDWSREIEQFKIMREQNRRVAIIRSIPFNLKDKGTAELLQHAQGSIDDGVLTIRSKQQRVLDLLADKVDAIRKVAQDVVGEPVTITLLLDDRKAA